MIAPPEENPPGRRPQCERCLRPLVVCYCSRLATIPTRTRILFLQHPREEKMPIGTARMAHLSLPHSELRVGVDFATDPVVSAAAASDATYVLFPGAGAIDVATLGRDVPITLIVVDGTWSQARKLITMNPALAALPRVAFTPRAPSNYRIRRQPAVFCVSTIEALAEVLPLLEPQKDAPDFERLLDPFRSMVEKQEWYQTQVRSGRHQPAARARRARRQPTLAMRLFAEWQRLVCVQGEANAWSRHHPDRQDPELVHWVAHRPATGETFEAVIAPRRVLGPSTPAHVELSADRLKSGISLAGWLRAWQDFSHADDVLVHWGNFYQSLALADGMPTPAHSFDLRAEVTRVLRERVGTVDVCASRMGVSPPDPVFDGRAGRRLACLTGLVRHLIS